MRSMTLTIIVGIGIRGRTVDLGPIVAHEVVAIADEAVPSEAAAKSRVQVVDTCVHNSDARAIAGICKWDTSICIGMRSIATKPSV